MPVYNGEKFLSDAINSILTQTFTEFEFIIIDDGSTDNTSSILSEYEKKDLRIKVIHQNNQGIVSALNVGIKNSRGEYIARMDSDDISLPVRISLQVNYLVENPEISVVGCFTQTIDEKGNKIPGNQNAASTNNEILWSLCFSNPIPHPGVMFRKRIIENINGYRSDYLHAEDYDLWTRLAKQTFFYNIPETLLLIRRHLKNITSVYFQESLSNSIRISQTMISQIAAYDVPLNLILPLWVHQEDNYSSAIFLIRLSKKFQIENFLTKNEKDHIVRETLNKLAFLAHLHSFNFESIKIVTEMLKFNPLIALSILINKIINNKKKNE